MSSSSSSSSSSDPASTVFSDQLINDILAEPAEDQVMPPAAGMTAQQEEQLINAYITNFLNPDSFASDSSSSSSSSSSSTSSDIKGDEKDAKLTNVREALVEALKKSDGKDKKDVKLPFVQNALGALESKIETAHSYLTQRVFSLSSSLAAFLRRPIYKRWHPPLTAPAHRGNFVVVGTDDSKSTENFLCCLNTPPLDQAPQREYFNVLSTCLVAEPARYPTWISATEIVSCTLTGSLNIYSFDLDSKQIAHAEKIRGVHTKEIRELALCPSDSRYIASTGSDRELCVTDLKTGTLLAKTALTGVGSSVKWSDMGIGLTTDQGRIQFFDIRTSLVQPQINFHLGHLHSLYTHARYGPYSTLLGYANGDIRNVDLRTFGIISSIQDPYVEGIGMIECRGNSFVTSGFCDFSVWNQDTKTRETNIWSHSRDAMQYNNDQTLTYIATWMTDDIVLATDSQGFIGTWTQDLPTQVGALTNQLAATHFN